MSLRCRRCRCCLVTTTADGYARRYVLRERVGYQSARALRVLGFRVRDEGDEAREEVARYGLVCGRGRGLQEQGLDAVGGDLGSLDRQTY